LRVGQKILVPAGSVNEVGRGTSDTDVEGEARALAAKLNGLQRFKDDPERHARAVLSLFPDDPLRKMLENLPELQLQEGKFKSGAESELKGYRIAISGRPETLDLTPDAKNREWAAGETKKQLRLISERVNRIISEQQLRLEVLESVGGASPGSQTARVISEDDEEKEIRRIQAMIQNSPDLINAPNGNNGTVLFRAARDGQLRVASFLLDHGADINGRSGIPIGQDGGNWTPLMAATDNGHKAMVELLLDRGADVNAKSGGTGTALHIACKRGFRAITEVLLRHKADPNVTDWEKTPLHEAAAAGNLEIVKALIASGANVNAKASTGSPIWMAVWLGHVDIVKALLAAKADPDIPGEKGLTPLCIAAQDRPEIVDLLLIAKADPNITAHSDQEKDNTPLHTRFKRTLCRSSRPS
jgi:ankyrin repeat protein